MFFSQLSIIRTSDKFGRIKNAHFLKSPTAPFALVWKDLIKTFSPLTRFYLFRSIAQNDVDVAKRLLENEQHVILERYFLSSEAFNWALDEKSNVTDPNIRSENHVNYSGLLKNAVYKLLFNNIFCICLSQLQNTFKLILRQPCESTRKLTIKNSCVI